MRIVRLTGWPETEDDATASAAETLHATYPVYLEGGGAPSWIVPTGDIQAVMEWLTAQTTVTSSASVAAPRSDAPTLDETPLLTIIIRGGYIRFAAASTSVEQALGTPLLRQLAEKVPRGGFRAYADGQPLPEGQPISALGSSGTETNRLLYKQINAFRAVNDSLKGQGAESFDAGWKSLLADGASLLRTFAQDGSDWREVLSRLPPGTHVHVLSADELPVAALRFRTSAIQFHLMNLIPQVETIEDAVRELPVLGLRFALSVSSGATLPIAPWNPKGLCDANSTRKILFLGDGEVEREMEAIMDVLPGDCGWEAVEPPTSLDEVDEWLALRGFRADIVHISSHNNAGGVAVAPGRSHGAGFAASQLDPSALTRLLSALVNAGGASLVFLNTCSADLEYEYEEAAGMPPLGERVVSAGVPSWVSTIGTLGFPDKRAFAAEFYRELLVDGRTVGDSMRNARLSDLGRGRLTWTKYVLHGDPTLRIG